MIVALECRPIDDPDIFWQVRLGELMLDSGTLVDREPFLYRHEGEPNPAVGWLAQAAFAGAYRLGSWPTVRALHVTLFAGAFVVAGLSGRGQGIGRFSLGLAVAAGFLAVLSNNSVRPQSFGLLGFSILLALARGRRDTKRLLLAAFPVLLVWQNCHPSVLLGGAAVGVLAAVGWARVLRWERGGCPWGLTFLLILTILMQFATPMGAELLEVTRVNLIASRDGWSISEWQPAWHWAVAWTIVPFWVELVVTLALLIKLRFRVEPEDLALAGLFTLLALSAARHVLFWAMVMVPIWARWVEKAKPAALFRDPPEPNGMNCPGRIAAVFALASVLLLWAPALFRQPVVGGWIPRSSVFRLKRVMPVGRVYNARELAGILLMDGPPGWRVAYDGRLYRFRPDEALEARRASRGELSLAEMVTTHRPDAFFLFPLNQGPLIALLKASPNWKEIDEGPNCAVFMKSGQPEPHFGPGTAGRCESR